MNASYRVPGSTADTAVPSTRYADDPTLSNDDVKATLTESASSLSDNSDLIAGDGLIA